MTELPLADDCDSGELDVSRRRLLQTVAGLGIGSAVFQRSLATQAQDKPAITAEMVQQAEWVAGISLTDEQREQVIGGINRDQRRFSAMRKIALPNSVPPALVFRPTAGLESDAPTDDDSRVEYTPPACKRPESADDLTFLPVTQLASLLRGRQISSTELTKLYLDRLHKYDASLLCVVNFTDELALRQAARADHEIAAGRYRGPLHGIPWGAKDLIAVPGYPTTWGAKPFEQQQLDVKATVVQRLEDAGAVLVAKLTLGALALGDKWFRGMTRNPWNLKEGSSGSSAGSASAVTAGLVGFAIGSETLGSIVSPCRRCGTTGLRPTFGRVSRFGCMTLSWSMDKLGPIARSVEDCALVLGAIHGRDVLDAASVSRPFHWPIDRNPRTYRVGYFESDGPADRPELAVLRDLGVQLVPIELPKRYSADAIRFLLDIEAACAFDEDTRAGKLDDIYHWPIAFRAAQLTPAIEYVRANRIRSLLMQDMDELMRKVDLYVGGDDLAITNLTGHPTVVIPSGMEERGGAKVVSTITLTGRLYAESDLLHLAHAFQQATAFHLARPPLA